MGSEWEAPGLAQGANVLMCHITSLRRLNEISLRKQFAFDISREDLVEMHGPHKTSARKEFVTGLV